jgi:predicted ArsR family transcriptional regulator
MSGAALARSTDPSTSFEAAASVDVTRLEGVILDKLKRYAPPGATSYELAEALGLSLVTVSPRLRPLQKKGLVRDSGFRARGESGRLQIIWRAA